MNKQDLETFLQIVESGSLLKASEKLYLAQSTVSNRLNALENELGLKLVNRNPGQKYISLTPKGEEFIHYARKYNDFYLEVEKWKNNSPEKILKIGSIDSFNTPILSAFYKDFIPHPSINLDVSTHWSDRIFSLIESHALDIGFVPRILMSQNVNITPIFRERLVFVHMPSVSKYPDEIVLTTLNKKNEIYFDWDEAYVAWHKKWFDPNINPLIAVDITSLLFYLLSTPNSWAIAPINVALTYQNIFDIKISEIQHTDIHRICYLVKSKHLTEYMSSVIEDFEKALHGFIGRSDHLDSL